MKADQRIVRLNAALVHRNWVKKQTGSLVLKFLNAVDSTVQQLLHDDVDRLLQRLQRTSVRGRVPCVGSLTLFPGWRRLAQAEKVRGVKMTENWKGQRIVLPRTARYSHMRIYLAGPVRYIVPVVTFLA